MQTDGDDDRDYKGRKPSDFIGRKVPPPSEYAGGVVIDGYVDAVSTLLLEVKMPDGRIETNVSVYWLFSD